MRHLSTVVENGILVVNKQFEDGNVACYLRGDVDGLTVKVTPSQIPSTRLMASNGKTVTVPTSLAKGDALYVSLGILQTPVDNAGEPVSNFRRLQGIVSLSPEITAAVTAAAADLPEDDELL